MIGVNSASDRYCALLKIAPATPRSEAGNQAAMIRPEAGPTGDSAAPRKKRSASSRGTIMPMKCTMPIITVKQDQATTASIIERLEPIQSVSQLRNQALTVLGGGAPADGRTLYNGNCASCHGWQGTGVGGESAGAYPSLLHNTALGTATPNNLTMVVLHGVSRQTNQVHVAMPGFADQLSDADVATLVNFLSMQFGNPAATTSAANVAKMR